MIINFFQKKIISLTIYFLIFNFNPIVEANEIQILVKINNEVITNIDIEKEYRYLVALNSNLKNIEKPVVIKIAKNSIIKEKIKKIEILKNYEIDQDNEYFNKILIDFYKRMNIKNEADFKKYLSKYDLTVDDIKEKLKIEALWNEMIFAKFRRQIEIDEKKLKQILKKKISNKKNQNSYLLYEILFNAESKTDLIKKYKLIKNNIDKIGFQKTANIYSESESVAGGGKLGWINENQLSDTVKEKLNKINIGEYSDLINVPAGSLILKIENKKLIKQNINFDEEFKKLVTYEKNRQLNQFSSIYLKKIKNNLSIDEK